VPGGEGLEGLVGLGQRVAGLDRHREGAVGQQPGQALQLLGGGRGGDVAAARPLAGAPTLEAIRPPSRTTAA
jgi:hypothetical protein